MAQAKKKQEIQVEDEMATELAEAEETATEVAEDIAEIDAVTEEIEGGGEDETEPSEDEVADKKTAKAGKRSAKAQREEAEAAAKGEKADEPKPKPATVHKPNPRNRHGKQYLAAVEQVDRLKLYEVDEAIELAKKTSFVKFDASVELHVVLGIDPRQADQMVRANVTLPAGTGKTLRIAVVASDAKQAEAKKAGADLVGGEELIAQIEKGKLDFDLLIATPDMMPKLAKAAKVLGPRGLMPNPKSGTVNADVAKAVTDSKGGRVEFRIDKQAIVHLGIGRVSFKPEDLKANLLAVIDAILKAKPSSAKGTYVNSIAITTAMGPGIRLDVTNTIAAANPKR